MFYLFRSQSHGGSIFIIRKFIIAEKNRHACIRSVLFPYQQDITAVSGFRFAQESVHTGVLFDNIVQIRIFIPLQIVIRGAGDPAVHDQRRWISRGRKMTCILPKKISGQPIRQSCIGGRPDLALLYFDHCPILINHDRVVFHVPDHMAEGFRGQYRVYFILTDRLLFCLCQG